MAIMESRAAQPNVTAAGQSSRADEDAAICRERQLKRWTRAKKEAL
jgi:predicted GIY-YIG superfamily endonuclease